MRQPGPKYRRADLQRGLRVLRTHQGRQVDWPVVRACAEVDGREVEGVVLGGTTFVSWSAEPTTELRERVVDVHLAVGGKVDGVIGSVLTRGQPWTNEPSRGRSLSIFEPGEHNATFHH